MCRLCAFTTTNNEDVFHQLLMHHALLMANADIEPQRDGWGVSDGLTIEKGGNSYRTYDPTSWMNKLNPERMWIGHVRKASYQTAIGDAAAHPFQFPDFIGMHNGTIYGTIKDVADLPALAEGEEDLASDTWRAFRRLSAMLSTGATLDSVVDSWLSRYEDNSAFVIMLLHNQQLHVIRGPKTRDLYFAKYKGGLVFHTDEVVLQSLNAMSRYLLGEEMTDITEFPSLHYAAVNPDENTFSVLRKLEYNPKSSYQNNTHFQSANYTQQPIVRSTGRWVRVTRTKDNVSEEVVAKQRDVTRIRQYLYPMRETLVNAYVLNMLGKEVVNFKIPAAGLIDLPKWELEAVLDSLAKTPLTDEERKRITIWNSIVAADQEATVFVLSCDDKGEPFWSSETGAELLRGLKA